MPRRIYRRQGGGLPYEDYAVICKYVIAKARRYDLPLVGISDNMLIRLSEEQMQTLCGLVAAAGYRLKVRHHHSYVDDIPVIVREKTVSPFGKDGRYQYDTPTPSRRTDKHNYYE